MKKIVSNTLIVSTQLIVGALFLFMLFSDKNEDNRVVVIENNNLNKMADAVAELFVVEHAVVEDNTKKQQEEELKAAEQRKLEEEAKAQAEAEALRIAQEEEARRAQEEALRNQVIMNANGYASKPGSGFNVTTDNRTYSLNNGEFSIVAGVVACEAVSKDDALAVMSVILNRADARGISPVSVVTQAGQFGCYDPSTGTGKKDPSIFANVVKDALDGIRNNSYHSFNGRYSGVSDNYIVANGNRFY